MSSLRPRIGVRCKPPVYFTPISFVNPEGGCYGRAKERKEYYQKNPGLDESLPKKNSGREIPIRSPCRRVRGWNTNPKAIGGKSLKKNGQTTLQGTFFRDALYQ